MKKGWGRGGGGGSRCWTLTLKTPPWVVTLIKSYGTTKLSVSASGVRSGGGGGGGGSNREQPFFSLALRLSTCVASRSATKKLLRNEQPLGSVCLLRKTKKSCQKRKHLRRDDRTGQQPRRAICHVPNGCPLVHSTIARAWAVEADDDKEGHFAMVD